MRQPLLLITLSLAVLLSADVLAQGPVQIQFQPDPVLVQTGTEIVFTVVTVPQVLSITWEYQGGLALGLWTGTNPVVNPVPQFLGRVTITATQLRIGAAQLGDAGDYKVLVIPSATTGQLQNSRSVQLRVFDAVVGVSLSVPSVAVEGKNVSLRCTWAAGTEVTVLWGKGGAAIPADSRITISAGSLDINPARRGDAGEYTCTVSNPVSAQTATRSLTVYYGPDTPVVTKETPKDCVGGGDVLVGQTVRLTCTSDSLPPAQFSWQRDGQGAALGQPDSGSLNLQTFSTDESGLYVCTAKNAITAGSSEKGTDLAVVETCLDGGEVAGIVIGCFLLLLIIVLLIVLLIVCLRRKRRDQSRQRDRVYAQETNPNRRPLPPEPQPIRARELGQDPPLHYANPLTRQPGRSYSALRETRGNLQTVPLHSLRNSDTHRHNGHTHTNGVAHNAIQNTNSYPHNGIDNPAFTHSDAQNANTLPNTQQQNSNILIQAGPSQGGNQQPAVQVSLNTQPQTAQNNSNAQMPTIHVNLNSYPTNGQQPQQDASLPFSNTTNNNTSQTQQNPSHAGQSNPRMQSGQSYPSDPRLNGHIEDSGHQAQRGLVPTGYTHQNNNNISRQNADTQTYEDPARRGRSERIPERHSAPPSSSRQQMPWDRERGTPSYPSSTLQRRQLPTEYASDSTDSSTRPPIREARTEHRSRPQSHSTSRSQEAPTEDRRSRGRSADPQNVHSVAEFVALRLPQRSPPAQREREPREIRGSPARQIAPRQEATHSYSPQALPHRSQQASVGHAAMSQGATAQRGRTAPPSADTRALADPNHLPQAHTSQQQRAAPIQNSPQGLGTQPVAPGANQPRQGGTAPVPHPPTAQPNPTNLTQAALTAHTARAQTFQNRKQQTQAALLHPGPQTQAPAVQAPHAPIPPPVMPLAQFKTLPKERTQHRSPARGPQPPRPPVNIPVSQRHLEEQKRLDVQRHPVANHHHHPGNGHVHASANRHAHPHAHARGHGHPAHPAHPAHPTNTRQQQAHGGRPR